jgi:hypothetical protein
MKEATGEIPHLWAHRTQDDARNKQGNLYFTGDTIYSYPTQKSVSKYLGSLGEDSIVFRKRLIRPRKHSCSSS